MNCRQTRLGKIWDWMETEEIALAMFEDFEPRRDSSIRWLTGQPGDALLFLSADRKSLLVPWDAIMAKKMAKADATVPFNDFDRSPLKALAGAAKALGVPRGSKVEIPSATPYPAFLGYVAELSDFDVVCRENGVGDRARDLRAVKDEEEIAAIRKAADATNKIIDLLEKRARAGKLKTEADAALLIEIEARKRGCEGTGFQTLAAGPDRSFGIHAFPAWTDAPFAGRGLSILDFGLRFDGYNTDVTLTFARDLNPRQRKMTELVEKAAKVAESSLAPGVNDSLFPALLVDEFLAKSKRRMTHGLGHGIGLDVHEAPFIRSRQKTIMDLEPGMFLSIEPGLYDPAHGGCRLENDYLITEDGFEALTEARIIRL